MPIVPLLIVVVLLVIAGGTLYATRMRRIRALEAQLTRLADHAKRPVAELLAQRQRTVNRNIAQAITQLKERSAAPDEVEKLLPRFHQQIARLEQDQNMHHEVASAQKRLSDWIQRLDGHPIESEAFELRSVAQNAFRITTALIDEGDLPQAKDTAVHADNLLKKQYETLEQTTGRLREIQVRIAPLLEEAEASNARILMRGPWSRATELRQELERLDLSGRVTDALIAATRLLPDLQGLIVELKGLLEKQRDEKRASAAATLAELLLWPPESEKERRKVRESLEKLERMEQTPANAGASLSQVREELEQAQAMVDAASELTSLHRRHWALYVESLTARLRESSLSGLAEIESLPPEMVNEAVSVGRLRTRVEPRLGKVPGWQVADEVLEILDRERRLLDQVTALMQGLRTRIDAQRETLAMLKRVVVAGSLAGEPIGALEREHAKLVWRFDQRDYGVLEHDLETFEESLKAELERARDRCIDAARRALTVMEQTARTLREEGLEGLAGDHGYELERDVEALRRAIASDDAIGAMKCAGDWSRAAPNLLVQVRHGRYEQWRLEKEGLEAELRATHDLYPRASIKKSIRKALQTLEDRGKAASAMTGPPAPLDDLRNELEQIRLRAAEMQERIRSAFTEVAARAQPPADIDGLTPESRAHTGAELSEIRGRLEKLQPQLDRSDSVESDLRRISDDLSWILLRVRKELAQRFLACVNAHQQLLDRLAHGTVQFYLPADAHEVLQDARKLQVECNPFLKAEGGHVELTGRLLQQQVELERLWREALPRARRFYEKQLGVLDIELGSVEEGASSSGASAATPGPSAASPGPSAANDGAGEVTGSTNAPAPVGSGTAGAQPLPVTLRQAIDDLRSEIRSTRTGLETEGWEESILSIDGLTARVRAASDRVANFRKLCAWIETQRVGIREQVAQLGAVGCQADERALQEALKAWDTAVAKGEGEEALEARKADLLRRRERAVATLKDARADIEKSIQEQKEVERWREVLGHRKQDLDWVRSCLKDVLGAGPEGLDLRGGLGILQQFQRSLDAISLDLRAAESHDRAFRGWLGKARDRAEAQFRKDFAEEIDSLHEQPSSLKALCAEVLTHVDSVLSSGQAEPAEQKRYHQLQKRGDAYHRLFAKKFSS